MLSSVFSQTDVRTRDVNRKGGLRTAVMVCSSRPQLGSEKCREAESSPLPPGPTLHRRKITPRNDSAARQGARIKWLLIRANT